MKYAKVNRNKKTEPKHGLFWCNSCDRQIVHIGQKCPVCGLRDKSKRRKK